MPESPEAFYARVAGDLRRSEVETWDSFPFEGDIRLRELLPPRSEEVKREGAGGADCESCSAPDEAFLWTDANWRLRPYGRPCGLPVVLFLEPRVHVGEPGELPDPLAAEFGLLVSRIDRAVLAVGEIARVHISRWGEGAEHLHWWFMARPARMHQLASSFAEIWDDILPPTPQETWDANLAIIKAALGDG